MIPVPNKALDSPKNHALKTGPPLVGIILNWWLFGILLMQYLFYLSHMTRKDKKIIRAIVHLLFLLDTVQSILTMEDAFHWFVYNFGNYAPLVHSGLPGIDSPFLDSIIAMIVQFVYCWRIRVLSTWKVFPAIITFVHGSIITRTIELITLPQLAFVSGANGIVNGIYSVATGSLENVNLGQWYIPAMLWLWASVATDILIATTMVYLLKFRSRCCGQGLKAFTKRVLILTLETNTLTAIVAMVTAVLALFPALAPPFTNLHRLGGYVLGKLYSNCFMVLLNQRIYYEKLSQEENSTPDLETLEFAPGLSSRLRSGITNSSVTGEGFRQFSDTATQVNSKLGRSDDVEPSQSMRGL